MNPVFQSNRNSKRRYAQTLGILLLASSVAAACSPPGAPAAPAAQGETKQKPVKTAKVERHLVSDPREQLADVVASVKLDVITKAGGQVTEVLKNKGEAVKAGEVLFRIDSRDAASQVEKNQVSLTSAQQALEKAREDLKNSRTELLNAIEKAQQTLDNAKKNHNKMMNDYDNGLVTKRQLEQSEETVSNAERDLGIQNDKLRSLDSTNSLASQESQLESNRIAISDAQRALENYEVKAPADGILTDFTVEKGMTVSQNFTAGQVQSGGAVKFKTELTESAYAAVKNKKELTFYAPAQPDLKEKAAITFLSGVVNAQTKTYTMELQAVNPQGSYAAGSRVLLQLTDEAEETVIAVPTLSIVREGSDAFVYVLNGDKAEKRAIKTGRVKDVYQEVLQGLKEGETIITSGMAQLKDGQTVTTAAASAAPAAGAAEAPAAAAAEKK
ncbi:efflux RND transporter periplasmic adaptor subunit [Paenibacillus mucilaginosus]|uniref:RND family efflux transporter MFP subunit n=1 Tax=Paenibacillus mucilaginosus (strain KNP414) TaxID=1036673 RepID=F8FMF6_PAEMK|nr:efflux RND transporter periplasmic adaptor subunit [Paenibacillus mucilaginosus]AEI40039.1 RND family efflux transporter MFP subunit [Paenibacillus mucilaginosus KNP414]MCG7215649.1 efflux RND transporter periplasmic adaptor subunit [Paenibacillus mucilaginosus]WDM29283.1 efflux RND transporter periplasmic adaptor subunit [Paenibacillus mucilaginosus]